MTFDNSNIDSSGLSSQKPIITYDTNSLELEGYELKYVLDSDNPVFIQVLEECQLQNKQSRVIDSEGRQKHIWIK